MTITPIRTNNHDAKRVVVAIVARVWSVGAMWR